MKLAMFGTGRAAGLVSPTLCKLDEIECYAIAARNFERAQAHAEQYGFQKVYHTFEELLRDPEVELVYIATPHSLHYEHIMMCLDAGKHVLCEKAFTLNATQARAVIDRAREKGLYLAEAMWTRYMPSRAVINEVLASGIIGTPEVMTLSLSYLLTKDRLRNLELGGGALLDLGVYGLHFVLMHFGDGFDRIETAAQMHESGVDIADSITLLYPDGRMAMLNHSINVRSDRLGIFHGDKGYMVVKPVNNPQTVSVYDTADNLLAQYDVSAGISGYEYEFLEAARCIREGKTESDSMPLSQTLRVMEIMDAIRARWGLAFPGEQ